MQIINDLEPGEVERFVLDLTSPRFTDEIGTPLEVITANSLTVNIIDDDGMSSNSLLVILSKFSFSFVIFSNFSLVQGQRMSSS